MKTRIGHVCGALGIVSLRILAGRKQTPKCKTLPKGEEHPTEGVSTDSINYSTYLFSKVQNCP